MGFAFFMVAHAASASSYEMRLPFRLLCTGSMAPTFSCGNVLYGVIPTWEEKQNLTNGTIVAYEVRVENYNTWVGRAARKNKASYVLHRIVGKNPDGTYILRGDANGYDDDISVFPAQIVFEITRIVNKTPESKGKSGS